MVLSAAALLLGLACATPASAEACGPGLIRSPQTGAAGTIQFWNGSSVPADVLWSDFRGVLKEYGSLDPDAGKEQQTYVGHVWYVEMIDNDGRRECIGPVALSRRGGECMVYVREARGRGYVMDARGDCDR